MRFITCSDSFIGFINHPISLMSRSSSEQVRTGACVLAGIRATQLASLSSLCAPEIHLLSKVWKGAQIKSRSGHPLYSSSHKQGGDFFIPEPQKDAELIEEHKTNRLCLQRDEMLCWECSHRDQRIMALKKRPDARGGEGPDNFHTRLCSNPP